MRSTDRINEIIGELQDLNTELVGLRSSEKIEVDASQAKAQRGPLLGQGPNGMPGGEEATAEMEDDYIHSKVIGRLYLDQHPGEVSIGIFPPETADHWDAVARQIVADWRESLEIGSPE